MTGHCSRITSPAKFDEDDTGTPAGSQRQSPSFQQAACHGADGNSISTDWPKLAGQNQKYLYEQLKYFRDGERMNVLMMAVTPYLQTLSDEDLLDISAFYSNYKIKHYRYK